MPRRPYLNASNFTKFVFTQGCQGCVWAQNGIRPRGGHNEDCRRRLGEIIAKDPLDDRTRKAKERSDHFIAESIEKNERVDDPRQDKELDAEVGDENTPPQLAAEEGMEVS